MALSAAGFLSQPPVDYPITLATFWTRQHQAASICFNWVFGHRPVQSLLSGDSPLLRSFTTTLAARKLSLP
jgi:hypothetical protein